MNFKILVKKYFFLLSLFSFLFLSSTALLMNKMNQKSSTTSYLTPVVEIPKLSFFKRTVNLPPNPVLKEGGSNNFPIISAKAALAVDLTSMVPLYEKNPDTAYLPASTTKIATALVAMDYYSDEMVLEVDGLRVPGQNMGLIKDEKIMAGSLLDGLLIYSANDAAEVLASNYPGGRTAFIEAMNNKTKQFQLENTHFENPTGFDSASHYSTARDLIRISIEAMKLPRFANIVNQKQKYVASLDGNIIHNLKNTNQLLGTVPGVLGVKTGWTENARENLVTYLERDGHQIMITVLGSQNRFDETKEIINWIFANYQWQSVNPS